MSAFSNSALCLEVAGATAIDERNQRHYGAATAFIEQVVTQTRKAGSIVNYVDQDLEEFASSLEGFHLDFRQLSKGEFRARTTIVRLDNLTLLRRTTTRGYALSGQLPEGILFYFPLRQVTMFANGRAIGPDVQLVAVGGKRIFSIVPEGYDHLIVALRQADLYKYLPVEEVHEFLVMAERLDTCEINTNRKLSLTRHLFDVFCDVVREPNHLSEAAARDRCTGIIRALQEYLRAHPDPSPPKRSSQERLLQRVLDLIERHPEQSFSLDEISQAVFASKRAIQYTFDSLVGISPMRYVKLHRLNLIRKELRRQQATLRFSSIVGKYSFSNAGRAVREYAELFGERPQETSARAKH